MIYGGIEGGGTKWVCAVGDGTEALPAIFELLKAGGVPLETISLSEVSLDDVFLHQTGRSLRDAGRSLDGEALS